MKRVPISEYLSNCSDNDDEVDQDEVAALDSMAKELIMDAAKKICVKFGINLNNIDQVFYGLSLTATSMMSSDLVEVEESEDIN